MADSFTQINSKISSLFVEIQRPIVKQSNELFVPGTHGNFSRISLCLLWGAAISLSAKWIRPNFHTYKIDFWKYWFTYVLLLHLSFQKWKSGILNNFRDQLSPNFYIYNFRQVCNDKLYMSFQRVWILNQKRFKQGFSKIHWVPLTTSSVQRAPLILSKFFVKKKIYIVTLSIKRIIIVQKQKKIVN